MGEEVWVEAERTEEEARDEKASTAENTVRTTEAGRWGEEGGARAEGRTTEAGRWEGKEAERARDLMTRFLLPRWAGKEDLTTYIDHNGELCIAVQKQGPVEIPINRV